MGNKGTEGTCIGNERFTNDKEVVRDPKGPRHGHKDTRKSVTIMSRYREYTKGRKFPNLWWTKTFGGTREGDRLGDVVRWVRRECLVECMSEPNTNTSVRGVL